MRQKSRNISCEFCNLQPALDEEFKSFQNQVRKITKNANFLLKIKLPENQNRKLILRSKVKNESGYFL